MKPFRNDAFHVQPQGSEPRRSTPEDIALIKGMLARGDKQSDIAAYWGTNSGRIAETNTGQRYASVMAAPSHLLPPAGPHIAATTQIAGLNEAFRRELQQIIRREVQPVVETLREVQPVVETLRREVQPVVETQQVILRQLAAFGRAVGIIEEPRTPRIGRARPMEA